MPLEQAITSYGLTGGILIWILVGIGFVIKKTYPDMVDIWKRRSERKFDLDKLQLMTSLGSRTFQEEQLTTLTAETQEQLRDSNQFIREGVSSRLDILDTMDEKLNAVLSKIDKLPSNVRSEIKPDLTEIATNYKKVMYELRQTQTNLTIIASLLEQKRSERQYG